MGLTFDEAVREYQLRSSIGPLVQGMKLSPFLNVPQQEYDRVKFLNNLFYETINKLRKEYAPTIEMTKEEKEYYASRTLLSGLVFNQNTQYYIDEVFNIDRRTAIAILHPETIKIVDE